MLALDEMAHAHKIAVFLSFGSEIDTSPLISALWHSGREVYLPLLHPFSRGNLLFLRYGPDTQLVFNRMKIGEPALDVRQVLPLEQLDVMITPLLGFDAQGNRIGMGGGYYDRTLRFWQRYHFQPIGLALDCQQVPAIPTESWDVPLPMLVTPSTTWRWAS
ncbi:5-formyltetrahydrofolate cyclo-ligase [Salmonella enterica subsp. enterica serovar Choleraesuis]|nr:5-formyltetrahydrofolate cyclo-ligase [Salmonella enterica subsp. enterica serovar Choleraesuis]